MTDWRGYVRRRLPSLDIPPERELEIVDELALQLEAAYSAAIAGGAPPHEALRRAEAEVPDWNAFAASIAAIERAARSNRHGLRPPSLPRRSSRREHSASEGGSGFARDLGLSARALVRAPGYTTLAVLTLALGLGLGTAAFSLMNGVLLAPLPYAAADRLLLFHATVAPEGHETVEITYPDAVDLAAETRVFSGVAAAMPFAGSTTLVDPPIRVEGLEVSASFFNLLGAQPALGRTFDARDGEAGAERVVVLGYAFWQRLGAPAGIIGRTMAIDEVPRTIVGVAPAGFRLDLLANPHDIFVPLRSDHPFAANRSIRTFRVIARLRDGVDSAQANAVASTVADRLQRSFPDTNKGRTFSLHPLQAEIVGAVRPVLWLVAGLVGLVLVVAGVTLASLLLARAVGRLRETTVRLALGASRWRLMRESLAEGLVVAAGGSAGGILIAAALVEGLRRAPGLVMPRLSEVAIDWRAGAALAVMAAAVVTIAALVPLTVMRRLHALSVLGTGHESTDRITARARAALVAAQIGVAFVLLASAALLALSLHRVLSQPLGFEADNVVTMRVAVPAARYQTREATAVFFRDLVDTLRAQPIVKAAGFVSTLPLAGNTGSTLSIQGREDVPLAMRPTVGWQWASPGFFGAMGMTLLGGRDFTDADVQRTPHVTVINETLARLHFAGEDPIGKRVYFGGYSGSAPPEWHEVIGVVADVRHRTLEGAPDARAYDLFGQHWGRTMTLVIRTPESALQAAGLVRSIVSQRDPLLPIFAVRTMQEVVSGAVATRRLLLWLVAGFAAVGLFVVLVGLYGTVSYMVARRTRELGVRLALGATRADIRRLILQYGLRIVLAGIGIGFIGALALKRAIETQLFGITAVDPAVLAGTALGLIAAALVACAVPAERALNADPARSLRCD